MKKLLSVFAVLALCLTACGDPAEGSPPPAASPTPSAGTSAEVSPVYSDWSRLEPYVPKSAVYTRRYAEFTDTLIPAQDYGRLLPFAGASLTGTDEWSVSTGWYDTYSLYGLVTQAGEVVLDPVLMSAFYLEETDSWGNVLSRPNVMMLSKVFYNEEGWPEERYALCAGDGSWCTDFLYQYNWEMHDPMMRATHAQGIPMVDLRGRLVFLDPETGEKLRTLDLAKQVGGTDFAVVNLAVDPEEGWVSVNLYFWTEGEDGKNTPLLYDPQGRIRRLSTEIEWLGQYGDGLVPAGGVMDGEDISYRYGYIKAETGEWIVPPAYLQAEAFENGIAQVSDEEGSYFINTAGESLTDPFQGAVECWGDYWYINSSAALTVLARDLTPVLRVPQLDSASVTRLGDGWVLGQDGQDWLLVRGAELHRLPLSLGNLSDVRNGRVLFCDYEGASVILTDLEGHVIAGWEGYSSAYLASDPITGERYVTAYRDGGGETRTDLYDLNGSLIAAGTRYGYLEGGLFCESEDDCTTLLGRDGRVIFRWPVLSALD